MVTGSMHLLEVGHRKILLDCGLYQGRREEARLRNDHFPFDPHRLDAVIISHAHIDHCGNLPTLIRHGYQGPIYCTPATRDLIAVMLADSARIQEEDAAFLNIQRQYAEPLIEPLYTRTDVEHVLDQCIAVDFHKPREIAQVAQLHLIEAGHILGAAMVHLKIRGPQRLHTVTFTGDLGRRCVPILKPSAPVPPSDLLVCESVYGNRLHEPIDQTSEKLYDIVNRTYARGGKILIPAFSLGRIQLIIHYLQLGIRQHQIPQMPIYVDSPLAAEIAKVYRRHPECLQPQIAEKFGTIDDILGGDTVRYIRDFEESMYLTQQPGPAIILAASGMCDAGRIVHHLKEHIDDPRSTVVLVSYQAHGTTGRRLLEPKSTVRFLGKDWSKWIDVVQLEGFSGHADRADFQAYLEPLVGKIGQIRLIHGEREQADALAAMLRDMGFDDVGVPEAGETVTLL